MVLDELEKLREHNHLYLTGKGRGHNNTEAETGAALFPDDPPIDDMDGIPSTDDACPATPEGFEVDAGGCALEEFCAIQERANDCTKADWQDDESTNPRDCRWRKGACEAL